MEYVLRTNNLVKKYGSQLALNNLTMNIAKGDIYGFVGENGSGKTTVIRLITGLIRKNSGSYELFGKDGDGKEVDLARRNIGAVVESPSIYPNMSAKDNLFLQAELYGIKDEQVIMSCLETVGLGELFTSKKKAGNFSLGMRQRLGIAMALLGEPKFLILDEPMNGLDPQGIVGIRELILKLNIEKGITFLISSHILTELSLVATKYGIISKGTMIKEITNEELKNECRQMTEIAVSDPLRLETILQGYDFSLIPSGVKIFGDINLNEVLSKIISEKIEILSVNSSKNSIEDYYLSLVGGNKND